MNSASIFLYLHIPKTGGSTLGSILFEQYHDSTWRKEEGGYFHGGVYYLPDGFIRGKGPDLNATDRRVIQREDITAVLGHFAFGMHRHLDRPAVYMTLLRDPIQRVVSLYHHMRQYDQLPPGMTLAQFVTTPYVPEACNDQVRRLAGADVGEPCDQALLDRAKKNLEQEIDLVGITERFDASLLLAKRMFAWNGDINYIPALVNNKRRRRAGEDAAETGLVERHNTLDTELYRFANELLDHRIAAQGPCFSDELDAYSSKNKELLNTHGPASTIS